MKNIFKIHPLYYLCALICIITGLFKSFIYISIIILIHELGHILAALICRWNINKVILLPFGGITIFNEFLNKSLKEEFFILISGPIFQIIICYILNPFFNDFLFMKYNYFLLIFNLLPIIPLDGSKLINIILNKMISFYNSHLLTIFISIISVFIIITYGLIKNNLICLIIIVFLIIKIIDEYIKHDYIFNKFLFERYNYKFKFNKKKNIKGYNLKKMKKDTKHMFYINRFYTEDEILEKRFKI